MTWYAYKRRHIRPVIQTLRCPSAIRRNHKITTQQLPTTPSTTSARIASSLVIPSIAHLGLPPSLITASPSLASHHRLSMLHKGHRVHRRWIQTLRHHTGQHTLHDLRRHIWHARHRRHPRRGAGGSSCWRSSWHRGYSHGQKRLHVIHLFFLVSNLPA